jgi:hypothetical protein
LWQALYFLWQGIIESVSDALQALLLKGFYWLMTLKYATTQNLIFIA